MKISARVFASFLLFLFACVGAMQGETAPSALHLQLHALRVTRLDRTGIQAEASLTMVPEASAHVKEIRFRNMRLDGIPVTMSPLSDVELRRGQDMTLPATTVSAAPGMLESAKALVGVACHRSVTLEGEVTITVRPGPLQRLLLHSSELRLTVVLHEQVPVDLAGLGARELGVWLGR